LFAKLAFCAGKIAGCVVWYETFSTFAGRAKLYIEDLYVRPEFRGKSIGKALIAELAELCVAKAYHRLQWSVLGWNKDSIGFYGAIGAEISGERLGCNLSGQALITMASHRVCCLAEEGNFRSAECSKCLKRDMDGVQWGDPIC
jgi:diamine N-acetyltransferase